MELQITCKEMESAIHNVARMVELRRAELDLLENKANKISSIIAILGLINIPIIKYSVDWWNTLHQPASIKLIGESSIHTSMLMPLLLMFFVLILYCALIFLMKYKTEIIRIKKKNLKRL